MNKSELQIFISQSIALTRANLKSRYRKTFVGFAWVVLNPIIIFSVQGFVFSQILRIHLNDYPLFLLSGLLPWIFVQQSLEMSTSVLVQAAPMLKAFPSHPMVYILGQVMDNLINFLAAFLLILIPVSAWSHCKIWQILLLPLPIFLLLMAVFAMAWITATVQVFFRDTRYMVTFLLGILFYLTPIFYPPEFVPAQYQWIIKFNLLYWIIRPIRILLHDFDKSVFLYSVISASCSVIFLFLLAKLIWLISKDSIRTHV